MSRPWSEATWRREIRAEIVRYYRARGWKLPRKRGAKRAPQPTGVVFEPTQVPPMITTGGFPPLVPDPPHLSQDLTVPLPQAVPSSVACPDCGLILLDRPAYLAHDIDAHMPARVAALGPEKLAKKGWTV